MKNKKLSKSQRELLEKIANGPTHCVGYYQPAVKLVAAGLAEFKLGGNFGGDTLHITDAGRERLANEQ